MEKQKLALQNGEEAPDPRSPGFSLQPPLSTDTELRDCADVRAQTVTSRAQLEFLRDNYFTVGDNGTYGGYYNAPLQPGKQYVVWLGVQDTLDGVSARTSCMVPEYLLVISCGKKD